MSTQTAPIKMILLGTEILWQKGHVIEWATRASNWNAILQLLFFYKTSLQNFNTETMQLMILSIWYFNRLTTIIFFIRKERFKCEHFRWSGQKAWWFGWQAPGRSHKSHPIDHGQFSDGRPKWVVWSGLIILFFLLNLFELICREYPRFGHKCIYENYSPFHYY